MNHQPLKLSWRVGYHNYFTAAARESLAAYLRAHQDVVDEVCFFDTITHHLYLPPAQLQETAGLMNEAMACCRDLGIPSVGANLLCTIGHMNEAWDFVEPLPFQPMVGHDGQVSRGCGCPNSPELQTYIRAKYRLFAELGPDFIWVDDDIRMHHHGVAYPCFCPLCLGILADTIGERFDREGLVAGLNAPERGDLRAAWVAQNVQSLDTILAVARQGVDDVDPLIEMGLMTAGPAWTTYSGVAFDRWCATLRASKLRPGGGFYTDAHTPGLYDKALSVGWQCAVTPPQVAERVYELENFPYQVLSKSVTSVMNECTMALGYGCNGVAVNALGMWNTPLADKGPLGRALSAHRAYWEAVNAAAGDLPTAGAWVAWTPQLMARRRVRAGEDWFAGDAAYHFAKAQALGRIGLPLATDGPGDMTVLSGRVAEGFTDEELAGFLGGGVLMDVATLEVLHARGLGELTGVKVAGSHDNGVVERFLDTPWNEGLAGEVRDARIEFFAAGVEKGYVLEPVAEGVTAVAQLETYFGAVLGPCLTAYENRAGGRVVVMGYAPWMFVESTDKRRQLQNLADWLAPRRLPVRIAEAVPVTPVARLSADRTRGIVMLLNWGHDWLPEVTVEVRGLAGMARVLTPEGETEVTADAGAVRLKDFAPWSTRVVALG